MAADRLAVDLEGARGALGVVEADFTMGLRIGAALALRGTAANANSSRVSPNSRGFN